jgi:hypothetical protein
MINDDTMGPNELLKQYGWRPRPLWSDNTGNISYYKDNCPHCVILVDTRSNVWCYKYAGEVVHSGSRVATLAQFLQDFYKNDKMNRDNDETQKVNTKTMLLQNENAKVLADHEVLLKHAGWTRHSGSSDSSRYVQYHLVDRPIDVLTIDRNNLSWDHKVNHTVVATGTDGASFLEWMGKYKKIAKIEEKGQSQSALPALNDLNTLLEHHEWHEQYVTHDDIVYHKNGSHVDRIFIDKMSYEWRYSVRGVEINSGQGIESLAEWLPKFKVATEPKAKASISSADKLVNRLRTELIEHAEEALRMCRVDRALDYAAISSIANQLSQASRNADRMQGALNLIELEKKS